MKSGIYAKLKWLTRPDTPSDPAIARSAQMMKPGWLYPQHAEELLSTPLRQGLMKIIWQRTSLSGALFSQLYQTPVARFAALVQQLPASEYHHHSHPGGLLDHTLEVMAFAAKLRQRHLLPAGAAPEDQAREAEAWTAGIIYAALLHDVGKAATDTEVVTDDNQYWYPWQEPLTRPYRLKYRKNHNHALHPVVASLLATQILPATALNWLAQYRELYESFLFCISGHYDQAGILGELVQEADRASVAQFMGANASAALERPQPSLPKQILTALRELAQSQLKLNNPASGSDGWLTDDALWLISKTIADRVRAWLLQQGVTGVPDSNTRLFDEMQAHGLLIPTPEGKAVWTCEINADSGWTPGCPLTLLRLPPARVWTADRPAPFAGKVTPVAGGANTPEPAATADDISTPPAATVTDSLADLTFSLFAPEEENHASAPIPPESEPTDSADETPPPAILPEPQKTVVVPPPATICKPIPVPEPDEPEQTASVHTTPGTGEKFIDWLRQGIATHKITVNDAKAPVHLVQGKVLLVSPGIFKLYIAMTTGDTTGEEWTKIQKSFQKLRLHLRGDDGINIFTCEVQGPRKTRQVKGYLLEKPALIFGHAIPEDNPYLSVISQP
ncbi:MobH family relaxase [Citrobacter sp. S2-9]|uniref:MobH family relaxase n=1 Tax=Citrobacter enshiensis TaxID=2971264 RepID=A0ABT8PVD7_9ENTR|nr:MobH family relaxase [Citrobacter enshiensis]MDN8600325.1 MobH family relaxase [Citrobacter enshiensis]